MKLILASLAVAMIVGYLLGGRLSPLATLRIRLQPLAILGVALQVVPAQGGGLNLALLNVSFVLLGVFALANVRARVAGFWLILAGIVLNFTVIALDRGMPVTREALIASGQEDTLSQLVRDGGAKHHLAGRDDRLLFLGDVVPVGPLHTIVSPGDLTGYAGVAWLVVAAMLGRSTVPRRRTTLPETRETMEAERVG
jgi:hypothetical protein